MARLYRSSTDKMLEGVCGGLAQHFGIRPIFVRAIFMLLFVFYGMGIFIYALLVYNMPRKKDA